MAPQSDDHIQEAMHLLKVFRTKETRGVVQVGPCAVTSVVQVLVRTLEKPEATGRGRCIISMTIGGLQWFFTELESCVKLYLTDRLPEQERRSSYENSFDSHGSGSFLGGFSGSPIHSRSATCAASATNKEKRLRNRDNTRGWCGHCGIRETWGGYRAHCGGSSLRRIRNQIAISDGSD